MTFTLSSAAALFDDASCPPEYLRDARLVRRLLGVELTREQFDAYAPHLRLSQTLGDEEDVRHKYCPFGIPLPEANGIAACAVLNHLTPHGVVFSLEGENNALRSILSGYLSACRNRGADSQIPEPYASSPLLTAVKEAGPQPSAGKGTTVPSV